MAARASRESGSARRWPGASPPAFVGRDRELAALVEALASGPAAVVLIEGEAGIGKSRLLHEFLASPTAASRRTLVAGCPPFREPFTLGPIVDALRQTVDDVGCLNLSALAGALRPLFPEWAADLPPALERAEDATAARHRLFRALAELLDRLSIDILVIEDVHWADEATVELLLFLTTRQPPSSAVMVTYRPDDVAPDSLLRRVASRLRPGTSQRRIVLKPLDRDGTARLVSSMLDGESLSELFADFMHGHTDGLPLAIEEAVRLLADRADLAFVNGEWVRRSLRVIAVPATLRDAVVERTERLGADAVTVLRAASVLAEPVHEATLQAVAELTDARFAAALTAAFGSNLLVENARQRLSFRHALPARAVYEAIPSPARRVLHRRAAESLQPVVPTPLAQLARHFRESGQTEDWCRYAERAADVAIGTGDDSTAAALLHDVVAYGSVPADTLVRLTKKLPFTAFTGRARHGQIADALRQALRAGALSPATDAVVRGELGRVLFRMEDYDLARVELARAVPHLGHDPAGAARCMTLLGLPHDDHTPVAEHRGWLRRAAAARRSIPAAERPRFVVDATIALLMLGDEQGWDAAAEIPEEPGDTSDRAEVARAHLNIGDLAMRWGRYAEARRRLEVALQMAERYQQSRVRGVIAATIAHLDWFMGVWAGLPERAAALVHDDELMPVTRAEGRMVTGLEHLAVGRAADAERDLRRALDEWRRRGAHDYVTEPAGALAHLWLAAGRVDDALAVTEEPMRVVTRKRSWLWATELAPARTAALIAAERLDEAASLAAEYARGIGRLDAPASQAAVIVCRGLVAAAGGQHARAGAIFASAAAAWSELPRPYDAALAKQRQADCLLAEGRAADAVALLSATHDTLRTLGASADAERVAATLRAQGVRPPRRGGRQSYGDQLSPRELEVVRLLVPGRSNPEIAAALVLSPKTVARHLDSAMRKLQVSSRTALAVRAVETGLVERAPDLGPV